MRFTVKTAIALALFIATVAAVFALGNRPSLDRYQAYFIETPTDGTQPPRLTATFAGTSTILISDGETSLLIDGFFSRPGLLSILKSYLGSGLAPEPANITRQLNKLKMDKLAAVICVHSHHDHAMDAPEIARQTGAVLVGSKSTANIGKGWGLPDDQIIAVHSDEPLAFGDFTVRMISVPHTQLPWPGDSVAGIGKEITEPFSHPVSFSDYREGGSYLIWIGHPLGSTVIQASANFEPGILNSIKADTVFLGMAGLARRSEKFKQAYYQEIVANTGAKTVIPIHWDNFLIPLSVPLQPFPYIIDNFDEGMDLLIRKTRNNPNTSLKIMLAWEQINLSSGSNTK